MIDTGLQDKVVLITGAGNPQGIGAATGLAFAEQGADLFFTYYGDEPAAEVLGIVRGHGAMVDALPVDLADSSAIPHLFDRVEANYGPVDVLINNAAQSEPDTLLPLDPAARDWAGRPQRTVTPGSHDRHFAVNSRAVALTMAEYARRHAERRATWGRIVNLTTGGAPGFAGEVSYGASKAALESYSRAAAQELARYGITVNIVSPGPIQTGWIPPELEEQVARETPLGRVGRPQDVADVILFLASEQARWITGATIHVDGGHRH